MMMHLFGRTGLYGGAPEWFPTNIGGCVLWLRSDLGAYQDAEKTVPCVADSLIWTGEDQVGVGGNDLTQATESKRFVYKTNILDGHPAWRTDGIDDMLTNITGSISTLVNGEDQPVTVFVVFTCSSIAVQTLVCWGKEPWGGNYVLLRLQNEADNSYRFVQQGSGGAEKAVGAGNLDTNPHYSIWSTPGTLANLWMDGSQIITNGDVDADVKTINTFGIGDLPLVQTQPFGGDYFEMAVYDNEISSASRTLLNNYAAARYPSI